MNEEAILIKSFVIRKKQDRLIEFLANPKRRRDATTTLAHFKDLNPDCVVALARGRNSPAEIADALRARGAGETCHVVSEDRAIDGRRMPLIDALEHVVGYGMGTLLSCVPGELAYFEGEGPKDRCILAKLPT